MSSLKFMLPAAVRMNAATHRKHVLADRIFRMATALCAMVSFLIITGIFIELVRNSLPSISRFGFSFLVSQSWDPVANEFGALSSVYGTIVSTLIALVIAIPMSLLITLFLVELAPPFMSKVVGHAIELLAAIPSIIFGMWGLFVFAPFMAEHIQPRLQSDLIPLFQGPPMGVGMLTAGIILALMILPFMSAVMTDVFKMVPSVVKEAGLGLGSTTWEVTKDVIIPYGIRGIIGATFLGLGRALGETMAVTFVIGNNHNISASLFAPANSIASTLANEFAEAAEPLYLSALMELGLILFMITLCIQILVQVWLRNIHRTMGTT